jgi:hypothetical protein
VASASPTLALVVASLAVLAAAVSGCATTQDANKRIDVRFDRTLTSRKPLELRGSAPAVQVVRTSVVDGKDGSAIVVVLRNRGDDPVNDLPIEVGPRGGKAINAAANVPYFQSHAPAIGPGDQATWVYVSKEKLGSREAFARVGAPAKPPITTAGQVDQLEVSDSPAKGGSSVQARVTNDTGIPQYDLDVYAVARKGGRYVAAGRAALTHLGVSKSAQLAVPLIGDAKGTRIKVFAPQTLFE